MENTTSETKDTASLAAAPKLESRCKMHRAASDIMAMVLALTDAGFFASALTPDAQTATVQQDKATTIQQGKELYDATCIICHGANLQGVKGCGKSLIGVDGGSVYLQVHSSCMLMPRNEAQAAHKTPRYSEEQTLAIAVYVQTNDGGAGIVHGEDGFVTMESLRDKSVGPDGEIDKADVARGSGLFCLNCASCHNFTGRGGALFSGKHTPVLGPTNGQEIYQTMLIGPQNMPRFPNCQLSVDERKDIVVYIKNAKETPTQDGWGLGDTDPITEGLIMQIVGTIVLVAAAFWIGSRR